MRRTQSAVNRFIRTSRLSRMAQESAPVWDLASAYVAGEEVADAVAVGDDLRSKGLSLAFTYLGGCDAPPATVVARLAEVLEVLDGPAGTELSVSPTALGLEESPDLARGTLSDLCEAAAAHNATVTLEMEGHRRYADTLALYRAVRPGDGRLGLTLPVDIRRAERDARDLAADGARIRLCVGAHPVPAQVAYRNEHDKSLALVRCLRILFESAAYPMLASHDPRIIAIAQDLAQTNGRGAGDFEFQMMHGVRPLEQRRLVDIGLNCRTYIPFGPAWYEYLASRIAARPRTLWNYARAILDKR